MLKSKSLKPRTSEDKKGDWTSIRISRRFRVFIITDTHFGRDIKLHALGLKQSQTITYQDEPYVWRGTDYTEVYSAGHLSGNTGLDRLSLLQSGNFNVPL